jgi:hypothetical protein
MVGCRLVDLQAQLRIEWWMSYRHSQHLAQLQASCQQRVRNLLLALAVM